MIPVLIGLAAWEMAWWARRVLQRESLYDAAQADARARGVPLLVVGAPDAGATPGPGCGDLSVDLQPSTCPRHLQQDLARGLPLRDQSVVVFVSCVLEYVDDYEACMRELTRVSASRLYIVRVEPWTFAAYLYPGAKRTLQARIV